MPTIQPKTKDVWVVGLSRGEERCMLLLLGLGLALLAYLSSEWLGGRLTHWSWWLGGALLAVLGSDWAFFEDRWVVDRRTQTAFLCRPFRRTVAYAFQDFERIERQRVSRNREDVYFVAKNGTRLWIARGDSKEFERSLAGFSAFMGLSADSPCAGLPAPHP